MASKFMEDVAKYYGITLEELKRRICNGERLIHNYYKEKGMTDE